MLCNIKTGPIHESDNHIFAKIPGGGGGGGGGGSPDPRTAPSGSAYGNSSWLCCWFFSPTKYNASIHILAQSAQIIAFVFHYSISILNSWTIFDNTPASFLCLMCNCESVNSEKELQFLRMCHVVASWRWTPFLTSFRIYRGDQCTYPRCPGVLFTSTQHNIF